jgi:hypothetical protein
MVVLIVCTSVGWFLLVVRIINLGSRITFLKSNRLSTSQGIRLLRKKFNPLFKCYFSQIQNRSIFKGSSHKSPTKSLIVSTKKILFLQKLSKNSKINNKWKNIRNFFFFYNFICSQFHPIQMKFLIVFFLNLDFFQLNSPY